MKNWKVKIKLFKNFYKSFGVMMKSINFVCSTNKEFVGRVASKFQGLSINMKNKITR